MKKENKKKLIIIFGIIILPLIYSLFYLGAFWNPYGSLDEIPVAIVNEDECQEECQGEKLVKSLLDDGTFKFEEVTKDVADDGLINKDYYAVITIPSNFTENLNSASETEKKQALITYSPNTKTNFLASQMLNSAVTKIEMNVESTVSKQIVQKLTDNLNDVPTQTEKIEEALGTINEGTEKLKSGTSTLENGTKELQTKYSEFNQGINKVTFGGSGLYTSYKDLDEGIDKVYAGTKTLNKNLENLSTLGTNVTKLNSALESLSTGVTNFDEKNTEALNNAQLVYKYIVSYGDANPSLKTDANFNSVYLIAQAYLNGGIDSLKESSSNIATTTSTISTQTSQLTNGVSKLSDLKDGVNLLETNLQKIKEGSNKFYSGLETLENGLETLDKSSNKIEAGITTLNEGAKTLNSGTTSLNSGVSLAQKEVKEKIENTKEELSKTENLSEYAEDSVIVEEESYGNVTKYGTAFAPYFMSLSLWVGGILILMGLYYDPDHRFKTLGRETNNRTLRVFLYCLIAIIQAIILGFLLKLLLGFEVTNIFLYYASCILISVTFLSIILFLFVNFKDVGKFLSLVLLVLQLAACGGTFPIETEPKIYQLVYPFMPMTYSLDLLKESFIKINSSFIVKDVIVLLLIWLIFTVLTIITGIIKTKKTK